jgi:polar amino acid transport system substrate-binding protein
MKRHLPLFLSLMLVAVFVVGCAASTPPPPPAPVMVVITATPGPATEVPPTAVPPTAAPTTVMVVTATPPPATAAPTALAQLPDGALAQKGKLLICSDIPYPPQEFYDENGNAQGLDVELADEMAARLGLQPVWINSVFDTIIPAVKSQKCDVIVSALSITADRNKQITMIPYFQAGQSMVVAKGNPQNINTTDDLCGKSASAESGSTEADYLQGTGDFKGKGLTQACTKAGKKPIDVVVTQKDTDALQQLQAGKVPVFFADSPAAAYYTVQHPDQFQIAGQILEAAPEGISFPCGDAPDCTTAPLTPLGAAIKAALVSMQADGTYTKLLTKWNLASAALTIK